MDIEISNAGKVYVLKIFPNLKILKRAFDDVYQFKDGFDKTDIQKKCTYLNKDQVTVLLDILLDYQDLDAYDIDLAFAMYYDLHGFRILSHNIYIKITAEVLLQLSLKPNTFYGRQS